MVSHKQAGRGVVTSPVNLSHSWCSGAVFTFYHSVLLRYLLASKENTHCLLFFSLLNCNATLGMAAFAHLWPVAVLYVFLWWLWFYRSWRGCTSSFTNTGTSTTLCFPAWQHKLWHLNQGWTSILGCLTFRWQVNQEYCGNGNGGGAFYKIHHPCW